MLEKKKQFSQGTQLIVVLVGLVLSLGLVFGLTQLSSLSAPKADTPTPQAFFSASPSVSPIPTLNRNQPTSGPVKIRIPKINVNAAIEDVGLTPDGAMDAPAGPNETGWYKFGPRPGENGSAVIDGHSGWKNNIPAVFDDLDKLQRGDKIYVEDEKGVLTTFTVRELRVYNPTADATEVFSSNDGKSYLNLITCTGTWDNVKRSTSERLVVFAEKDN